MESGGNPPIEEHHIEETSFLIDEVRKLAKEIEELKCSKLV